MLVSDSKGWLDTSRSSQVRVTIPEQYTDAEFSEQFDTLSQYLRGAEAGLRLLIVVHLKTRTRPENRQRAKVFFQQQKDLFKSKVKAAALVSESTAIRAAIGTARLLGLFPFPTKTFESVTAAESWLSTR